MDGADRLLTVLRRGEDLYLISIPVVSETTVDAWIVSGPHRTRPEVLAAISDAVMRGLVAPRFVPMIDAIVANMDLPWTLTLEVEELTPVSTSASRSNGAAVGYVL